MENGNAQTLGVGEWLLFALEEDAPEVRVRDINAGNLRASILYVLLVQQLKST